MSASFMLPQSHAVHMICDAASYEPNGVLRSTNWSKCIALPALHAAIATNGPTRFASYLAMNLQDRCDTFDEMVERGEVLFSELFNEFAANAVGGEMSCNIFLIGWHEAGAKPGCYSIPLWTEGGSNVADVLANSTAASVARRGKLLPGDGITGSPIPTPEFADACSFRPPRDLDRVDVELELLHLLHIARQEVFRGKHWVGGKAVLTSINAKGITQRIVAEFPEDTVGELIQPRPFNFKAWRAERAVAGAQIPAGLSRLQRERMEKKATKGTLRAVK